ncbi:hypothetical protein ACLOJK_003609 [Asimina triloba]
MGDERTLRHLQTTIATDGGRLGGDSEGDLAREATEDEGYGVVCESSWAREDGLSGPDVFRLFFARVCLQPSICTAAPRYVASEIQAVYSA